jgi:hypothetical protein
MNNIYNYRIFADCGAPSYYNKHKKIQKKRDVMGTVLKDRKHDDYSYTTEPAYNDYRNAYIEFLLANKDKLTTYSNLDVINNPRLTYINQRILEDAGLKPIPVFHLGSDEKYLKRYVDNYEYIALGGLIPNTTKELYNWLDRLYREVLLDEHGMPRVKVHGFACTSLKLMTRYPWYSVDSATARKLGNFGSILVPQFSTRDEMFTVQISSRDVKPKFRLTPGQAEVINAYSEKYGITLQQLEDNIIDRVAWNYLAFKEKIEELTPHWPWGFDDKSKPFGDKAVKMEKVGAKDRLTLYFAGVLSKSEEDCLWEALAHTDAPEVHSGRLQSFFYRKDLEYLIRLKHEGK